MTVRVKLHGHRVKALVERGSRKGLARALEFLLSESDRLVPLEEGTLARSGGIAILDDEGAVYYDTPYALRQHEELDWRHDPGRTAKYLETPFVEHEGTMLAIVAANVRRELEL